MKKRLTTMIVSMLLMFSASLTAQVSTWDGTWEPWTHGTGTEADPFLIENAQQLAYLAYRVNNGLDAGGGHVSNHDCHYKLMVDVNLNGSESFQWIPIGYWNSDYDSQCFGGCFDGAGHTIFELYINSSVKSVGLFGCVDGASIGNIHVNGNTVTTTGGYSSGLVGVSKGSTMISNCSNTCAVYVSSNNSYAGGIIGITDGIATISNCNNSGSISSNSKGLYYSCAGGIIGASNSTTTINNCYNTGSIFSSSTSGLNTFSSSGGIVGNVNSFTTIDQCYNIGLISSNSTGSSECGGIVGYCDNSDALLEITNCYNLGDLSSHSSVWHGVAGGITGRVVSSHVTNCYNTGNMVASAGHNVFLGGIVGDTYYNVSVSNSYYLNNCGGYNICGGEPKTEVYMKSTDFVEKLNEGFVIPVWIADSATDPINNGFPILIWQGGGGFGIEENDAVASHLQLYPNPANEIVTIILDGVECSLKQLKVFDVNGREVVSANASGQEYNLDVSGLPKGVYFVRVITDENNVANLKLLVK